MLAAQTEGGCRALLVECRSSACLPAGVIEATATLGLANRTLGTAALAKSCKREFILCVFVIQPNEAIYLSLFLILIHGICFEGIILFFAHEDILEFCFF